MAEATDMWKDDLHLKEDLEDLEKWVKQGLMRKEILDFVNRDYTQYKWSIRTLDRRLRYFDIYYNDQHTTVEDVQEAVKKELAGPGKLLGYRAMHKKIRQEHGVMVTRDAVYTVMQDLDPSGLERRGGVGDKKRKKKGHFTSRGPNWVHSLDGHDKLMGYQNSTFPLAIYGCIDTASRKILWLRVWTTNSDPMVIARYYLDYLIETKTIARMIRVDKGTETGTMATIHAFLRRNHDDGIEPEDTVIFGASTSNQIERWWKELHERMENFYKTQLKSLLDQCHYNPHDEIDRMLLAYIMIPQVQRELDVFKDAVWNSHRIRRQKDTVLPDGIPNHIHAFPEAYDLEECGLPLTDEQLHEACVMSGALEIEEDFLDPDFRKECERIIPDPNSIEPKNCSAAFVYLKKKIFY